MRLYCEHLSTCSAVLCQISGDIKGPTFNQIFKKHDTSLLFSEHTVHDVIKNVCQQAQVNISTITSIICATGPGSITGVRSNIAYLYGITSVTHAPIQYADTFTIAIHKLRNIINIFEKIDAIVIRRNSDNFYVLRTCNLYSDALYSNLQVMSITEINAKNLRIAYINIAPSYNPQFKYIIWHDTISAEDMVCIPSHRLSQQPQWEWIKFI